MDLVGGCGHLKLLKFLGILISRNGHLKKRNSLQYNNNVNLKNCFTLLAALVLAEGLILIIMEGLLIICQNHVFSLIFLSNQVGNYSMSAHRLMFWLCFISHDCNLKLTEKTSVIDIHKTMKNKQSHAIKSKRQNLP